MPYFGCKVERVMLYAIVFQMGILVPFCSYITENPNLIPPETKNSFKFLTKNLNIDALTRR